MLKTMLLWASTNRWLREQVPRYRFARGAVRRFMPGEELSAALDAAVRLRDEKMSSIVTYLGENVEDERAATAMAGQYIEALDRAKELGLDCEVSVKLTQLGLDLSHDMCREQLEPIVVHAKALGNFVWIDMESTAYTDVTLDEYEYLRRKYENVGVCVQAYLRRTPADLDRLIGLGGAIRLVKGAYAEPKELAFPKRRDVDEAFSRLGEALLEARVENPVVRPSFATHDSRLIARLADAAAGLGLEKDAYEYQLLYGIARSEQQRLAAEGYGVRVLISYGDAWYPWFVRRLAERPANLMFVAKNVFG